MIHVTMDEDIKQWFDSQIEYHEILASKAVCDSDREKHEACVQALKKRKISSMSSASNRGQSSESLNEDKE